MSLKETPEPLGAQRECKLGKKIVLGHSYISSFLRWGPDPALSSPAASLGPLTNGVARRSHSGPSPIRCWVKRLLNFGPDDPATASQQHHTSHAPPSPATLAQTCRDQLLSSFLAHLLPAPLPSLTATRHAFLPVCSADHRSAARSSGWRPSASVLPCVHHQNCSLIFGSRYLGSRVSRAQHPSPLWGWGLPLPLS